jgi:hypothetical protein
MRLMSLTVILTEDDDGEDIRTAIQDWLRRATVFDLEKAVYYDPPESDPHRKE